jgi:hypothetical protein
MKAWLKFHVGQLLRFVEVAGGDRVAGKPCRTIAAGCNMGKVSRRSVVNAPSRAIVEEFQLKADAAHGKPAKTDTATSIMATVALNGTAGFSRLVLSSCAVTSATKFTAPITRP